MAAATASEPEVLDSLRGREVNECWMFRPSPPVFILLGRSGDLIQMIPCFHAIFERTGMKPQVIVSREYAGVFDGVSYVKPYPIPDHWWKGISKARQIAESLGGNAVVPQWWNDDPTHTRMINEACKGNFVLQCHGNEWGVDVAAWPDYGTSMASRCGFTREEWLSLPLVFDRRSPVREERLWARVVGNEARPVILYNFGGISSPFTFLPEVTNTMRLKFGRQFRFVDLSKVMAERIYDMLGLYDRARGLLTSDTATLHLAAGSATPYVAFLVNGWTGSIPKGNCVFNCRYSETPAKLQQVMAILERWGA